MKALQLEKGEPVAVLTNAQVLALCHKTLTSDEFLTLFHNTVRKQEEQYEQLRSLTKAEFCELERMSVATYHKLKRAGYGPAEVRFPGMAFARITPQARQEWHALIEKLRTDKNLQLELERRTVQSREAGKRAAASPRHVSKRPRAPVAKKKAARR